MQYPPTSEQRRRIIKAQEGACLLCGRHTDLVIDHDHETGEIRGALCPPCNTGLDMFKDSTAVMYAAIAFLDGYRGIQTDESPIPNEPVSLCAGSWEPPLREGPAMYRCAVCDQSAGAKRQVPMEQIRGGRTAEYMDREQYPRGVKPNTRRKSPRKMSAVEAIH